MEEVVLYLALNPEINWETMQLHLRQRNVFDYVGVPVSTKHSNWITNCSCIWGCLYMETGDETRVQDN